MWWMLLNRRGRRIPHEVCTTVRESIRLVNRTKAKRLLMEVSKAA
jgi:hypothetical protein